VSWAGIVLVGLGVMLLAEQIGIDPDIMFPVLMVAVGALMLLRR
jgi:phage shock protein C